MRRRGLIGLSAFLMLASTAGAAPKLRPVDEQLFNAVQERNLAAVKSALARGADANAREADVEGNGEGGTPLIRHARMAFFGHENIDIARALIRAGARVDARDKLGHTPLMIASSLDWTALQKLLLGRGAAIEARDNEGRTPLMHAAWGTMTEIGTQLSTPDAVRLLLGRGAKVNSHDRQGQTALLLAAKTDSWDEGHREAALESVRLLLGRSADPGIASRNGNTALQWARARRHTAIAKILSRRRPGT